MLAVPLSTPLRCEYRANDSRSWSILPQSQVKQGSVLRAIASHYCLCQQPQHPILIALFKLISYQSLGGILK
jgi:hypothetical protein